MDSEQKGPIVYAGTYTEGWAQTGETAAGIYIFRLDPRSGALSRIGSVSGVVNPSFPALGIERRYSMR